MTTINLSSPNASVSTPTCALRWVPVSGMQAHVHKLQQAFEIRIIDEKGNEWKRAVEWRDVPVVYPGSET